jgi:hypothetical protein
MPTLRLPDGTELKDVPAGFHPAEGGRLPLPESVPTSRLTVTRNTYYQRAGESPVHVPSLFTRVTRTGEQAYSRTGLRLRREDGWVAIDVGWLAEGCGLVVVKNEGGDPRRVQPTDDERAAEDARGIEWGVLLEVPTPAPTQPAAPKEPVTAFDPPTPAPEPALNVVPIGWIPPGEDLPISAHRPGGLVVRALGDYARYSVHAFPR